MTEFSNAYGDDVVGDISLEIGPDGKFIIPAVLESGSMSPLSRALLNMLKRAVAAHGQSIDEITRMRCESKASVSAKGSDMQIKRKLGEPATGVFVHGAGPAGIVSDPTHLYGSDSDIPVS